MFDNAVTLRLTLDTDAVAFAFVHMLFSMFHSRTVKSSEAVATFPISDGDLNNRFGNSLVMYHRIDMSAS